MTVKTYLSTNKTLLDNSWINSDDTYYFQLVSGLYVFDPSHTSIFDVQAYFVGNPVAITGHVLTNTTLSCNDISTPVETASFAIIYLNNDLVFYFILNSGEDYTFGNNEKIELTTLLNFPASQTVFTSAMKSFHYDSALKTLYSHPFSKEGFIYSAQLLNNGYTFDSSHTTRADIGAYAVSGPLVLTSKTVTYSGNATTIDCDDLLYAVTVDASYVAITYMPSGSPASTDKLVLLADFKGGDDASVDRAIPIVSTGLFTINRAV